MTRHRAWLATVVLLATTSLAPTAIASGAPRHATDRSAKSKAQRLVTEGYRLARSGDFASALDRFREAYEVFPSPKILINIGTSLRHLGRHADAAATYERYLADPHADPARVSELEDLVAAIDRDVGWLEVAVRVRASDVRLDGNPIETAQSIRVDPGEHSVTVEAKGHPPELEHFVIEPGERRTLRFDQPDPPAPPPPPPDTTAATAQRVVGVAIAGLGGSGLIVGAVLGGLALQANSSASEHCNVAGGRPSQCDAEGVASAARARRLGTASTVALVAGGTLGAAGLTVYFTTSDPTGDSTSRGHDSSASLGMLSNGSVGVGMHMSW